MRLKDQGFEVTALFLNPNIHPAAEYLRRREGVERVAERLELKVVFKDGDYRPQEWFRQVAFREANRCFHCYQMRLERTRHIALAGGFDLFTTTLLYSRRQKHETIAALGRDTAGDGKAGFLYEDFRAGWAEGIRLSKEWDIYRQDYCGCLYSEVERRMGRADKPGRAGESGRAGQPEPSGEPEDRDGTDQAPEPPAS
jgi:predicted adenine nucleotide alpha hydrolase (AANH) superfamily ATPase